MDTKPGPLQFRIIGMDCADEVAILKREVGPVAGGEGQLAFDVLSGKMTVTSGARAEVIQQAGSDGVRPRRRREDPRPHQSRKAALDHQ